MSETFFECPRCGNVSTQETRICNRCSYSIDALPPRVNEIPGSGLAIPLIFVGIGIGGLVASFLGTPGRSRGTTDYRLEEIESGQVKIESDNVRLGPHVSIRQGGVYNASSEEALEHGVIDSTLYPIYSKSLYEKAMGTGDGPPPPIKEIRIALRSFRVMVLTDEYTDIDDVPMDAQQEESVEGTIVKRPGQPLSIMGGSTKQVKPDEYKDVYIIKETRLLPDLPNGVDQITRIAFWGGLGLTTIGGFVWFVGFCKAQ